MMFASLELFFSHESVVWAYVFSTLFVSLLSCFFLSLYKKEAFRDTLYILLGSLVLVVVFSLFFSPKNLFVAASLGVFTGELVGLFFLSWKRSITKQRR